MTKSTIGAGPETVFVDSNVLIYTRDVRNQEKRERASTWLHVLAERRALRVNLQVLNELTRWLLARAPKRPVDEIRAEIDELALWGDKPIDEDEIEAAWIVRERFRFNWFDCLLIAAADRAGCRYFLTEDMQDRVQFNSVTLINPFKVSPSDILSHQ